MALAKVKTAEEMARLDAIWAELEAHKDELKNRSRTRVRKPKSTRRTARRKSGGSPASNGRSSSAT